MTRSETVSRSRLALVIGGALLSASAAAVGTYEDCALEASKSPTEVGVNIAVNACRTKFRDVLDERDAADARKRADEADAFAAMWRLVGSKYKTVGDVQLALGRPILVGSPEACVRSRGRPAPKARCRMYWWSDGRAGRQDLHFRLQALEEPSGALWAWSSDSV